MSLYVSESRRQILRGGALSSTLAGNLLVVGSIANIIVIGTAQRHHVLIGWKEHARVGVPATLAVAAITGITAKG